MRNFSQVEQEHWKKFPICSADLPLNQTTSKTVENGASRTTRTTTREDLNIFEQVRKRQTERHTLGEKETNRWKCKAARHFLNFNHNLN